jgi:type IV pilus assembly protein PilA
MRQTLNRMKQRGEEDRGFTMIELLVVVVIIGILVAIAVPVYLNYRKGAANKSAASDVRGAITAVEQYYTENGNLYPADASGTADFQIGAAGSVQQTIAVSPNNTVSLRNSSTAAVQSYHVCAVNSDGKQVYIYNSLAGGGVKESVSDDLATCLSSGS